MSKNRLFRGAPTVRLITSVEASTVARIDELINYPFGGYPYGSRHPARGNRAEFVRLAIEVELARWGDEFFAHTSAKKL